MKKLQEGISIVLSPEKSEEFFHESLCNSLDFLRLCYGLELEYNKDEYKKSREKLENPCWEDVLLQMLKDGYSLTMVDVECDGEYTRSITIGDVHERVSQTPFQHLSDIIEESGDATTGDVILQTVFFGEVIFG
jgi:hypothetical protein